MTPRYVPADRPITPEQARLAVEAAGLDPSRPLDEQLGDPGGGDPVSEQLSALSAKVDALTEAQGGRNPVAPEQTFAEGLAGKLAESQSQWYSPSGEPENAA